MRAALAIAVVFVAAQGLSSATASKGRVIVVEHTVQAMAIVPGGPVDLGADADEFDHLIKGCRAAHSDDLANLCDDRYFIKGANRIQRSDRTVVVPTFAIDRHEVTVADYRDCVRASVCEMTALVAGDDRYLVANLPMVNVTWHEASDYCAWRGKRLPTEAEWEKAARGTDGRRFPWGNQFRDDGANVGAVEDVALLRLWSRASSQGIPGTARVWSYRPESSDGFIATAPPGSLPWGEGPYGNLDMAGNVREWTLDYFGPTVDDLPEIAPVRSAPMLRQIDRVVRGGSWKLPLFAARTYFRDNESPETRESDLGFRCARTVDPK